ncbi:MAG TPA: single-stranded-DNA-specific exonuclease RecJ [Bacteroidia bacterium]|jgi:single-stranded-DNA-specific exonuclease
MEKRWTIKAQGDAGAVNKLSGELNISPLLANLLVQRGINNFDEAKKFFRPSLDDLHDPFLMLDMDAAVARIEQAIKNGEHIMVFGDYDVDGTTAVALVYTFLSKIYDKVSFYIPDRYKEGYGISKTGIDFAHEKGFKLIIALDCGIKSVNEIEYAKTKGIDFIICDHHLPGERVPNAVAVLDPKRPGCNYPYKELPGCALGFKLAQAFAQKNNIPRAELEQYLDLVVVSIAADIVPITGENRVLAFYGLKQINTSPRQGLKTLLELNNIKKELTITDLVFIIGPRINAAGRIDSGRKSVELLISADATLAMESSIDINKHNLDRRDLDTTITIQALEMIATNEAMLKRKSTVVFHPGWHKGVVGIVASRLTEKYYRPTIVLTQSNGMISGSARSVKDFDVYEAINACSELLEQFGGHKYAAGLSMKPENLDAFTEKFELVVSSTIQEHMLVPEVEIDSKINLQDINPKMFNVLKQFAPFGPGNMSPVFVSEGVLERGYARVVGSNHLKLDLVSPSDPKNYYSAIAFGLADKFPLVSNKKTFSVCYCIEENVFNGMTTLQLNVKDVK